MFFFTADCASLSIEQLVSTDVIKIISSLLSEDGSLPCLQQNTLSVSLSLSFSLSLSLTLFLSFSDRQCLCIVLKSDPTFVGNGLLK
jgi:hypothetical protein